MGGKRTLAALALAPTAPPPDDLEQLGGSSKLLPPYASLDGLDIHGAWLAVRMMHVVRQALTRPGRSNSVPRSRAAFELQIIASDFGRD